MADKPIEVLLQEKRTFPPPKAYKSSANLTSAQIFAKAHRDPKTFWANAAKDLE
jgi:hypothetical protein